MQVDFSMAERLGAEYVAEDSSRRHPVMLHRAIVGSLARLNPAAFHRDDGAGYRFVAAQVQALDAINPQVAARLLGAFEGLPRWTLEARGAALAALAPMRSAALSRDVAELLGRLPA
jgi:aminopeptidase N